MVKVSVIVPVYNAEKYLEKCLQSLVCQTLQEAETILVNDGSTDRSKDILNEYAEKFPQKIKVVHTQNGGQGAARNLAIRHASGEYLAFIDSDDYADLSFLEKTVKKAEETKADMVVCEHYEVKNGKKRLKKFKDYSSNREMFIDALVSPWIKLIKRSVYIESGVSFPEGYIYEDTAWFANLLPSVSNFAVLHEPLVYHVVQKNSTMTKKQEERTENIFPVMDCVLEYYEKRNLTEKYQAEIEYFFTRILFMSSLRRVAKVTDAKLRKRLTEKSFATVERNFPNYKKNAYLRGTRKFYVKTLNRFTAPIFLFAFGLKG